MAGSYEIPEEGSPNNSQDPKIKTMLKGVNELLNTENKLGNTLRWQTPSVIAKEETRESATFGTLTTADEVKSVVLPENGLIAIGYDCAFKSSNSGVGRAAIFIGANQLKIDNTTTAPQAQEASSVELKFTHLTTRPSGLISASGGEWTGAVTTGQALGAGGSNGGLCYVFAAAGTYNISVQFKAAAGSVSAKERKLWVGVIGV